MSSHVIGRMFVFLALVFVMVSLAMNDPLPTSQENITFGEEQRQIESKSGESNLVADTLSCTVPLFSLAFGQGLVCDKVEGWFKGTLSESDIGKAIVTTVQGMRGFVRMLKDVVTFNIPGAPRWIQWAIGFPLTGTLAYIVIALIRGSG